MKAENHNYIKIKNASVHNLKNIDIDIPKNKIVVITGPSGSGKSSLAFDTIFVEGQKRFIESLFSSSRHYLDKFSTSSVEKITGLTPSISVEQKTKNLGPRSTVGTQTEIYDYLRVLFSKIGKESNQDNTITIERNSTAITNYICNQDIKGTNSIIFIKVLKSDLEKYVEMGFEKVFINDNIVNYTKAHADKTYNIVISRFKNKDKIYIKSKLIKVIENFKNDLFLKTSSSNETIKISNFSKGIKISPQTFSFNSPYGFCQSCKGLGAEEFFDLDLLITAKDEPLLNGGVTLIPSKKETLIKKMTEVFLSTINKNKENLTYDDLNKAEKNNLLYGSNKFIHFNFTFNNSEYSFKDKYPGLINFINKTNDEKSEISIISKKTCSVCKGSRLSLSSLEYKINGNNIFDLSKMEIKDLLNYFKNLKLLKEEKVIANPLIKEIISRLKFLNDIGLEYLTLNRQANTLSGGETQRIKIATQLGSRLSGVTYILDEPSIGLHPSDNQKLIDTLNELKQLNNSIIIVEHDKQIINKADFIIDIGPEAGEQGGKVVATGTPIEIKKDKSSITGKYLSRKRSPKKEDNGLKGDEHYIEISEINFRNIKNQNIKIPINSITAVTGVSGSGKSTIIHEVLSNAIKYKVANRNIRNNYKRNNFHEIEGYNKIKQIIDLDQTPIGRTNKSNPSTYLGFFTLIRDIFASTPEAKLKGYKSKHFSFNLKDGRCSECDGNGEIKIEMAFLPDERIKCKKCNGKRYQSKILNIKYKNHDIAQILNLTVNEAHKIFINHKKISAYLKVLKDIGLGYIKLGQPSTTMSGGEAQRLKIAKELSKNVKGKTLYILDEPSTGLHFKDIELLLGCIERLKQNGHTIIVIEHNEDIISKSDYIIEMGPKGGKNGGVVVYQGCISKISKSQKSITKKLI